MARVAGIRRSLAGEVFDVGVIGGGINGVAIARACAYAGRRTLLVEQKDFASGTTSRSTRIIHGGLRYLEHGELGLVRESLRARDRMLRERPHLVRPINFLLALPEGSRHSALAIRAGLWLYSTLAGKQSHPAAKHEAAFLAALDAGKRWSLFNYRDAQCEFPERLVAEWLGEAAQNGATVRNHCRVLEIGRRKGKAESLLLRDELNGHEERVYAAHIINATGPWVDRLCRASNLQRARPLIGGIRGSHIVLSRFAGAPASPLYAEGHDGRPVFVVPWNERLLVGTTEVIDDGDPAAAVANEVEISHLLQSLRDLFPAQHFSAADVQLAFAGIRPLPYSPGERTSAITRRHFLHDHSDEGARGLISVIGGKLTTAESLARECARKLGIPARHAESECVALAPADGIQSSLRQWARQVAAIAGIPVASAIGLAEWYGRRALCVARLASGHPRLSQPLCEHTHHLVAEAVASAQNEFAMTLADVLLRRVPVALGPCWSRECSEVAAARIGAALDWDAMRIGQELEAFDCERAHFLPAPNISGVGVAPGQVTGFPAQRSA